MLEKLEYFKTHHDHVRSVLTKEPRGSNGVLAALLTENTTPDAHFGLIYMDARRYPYLCGHATIGAVITLARTGFLELENGKNTIAVDTVSGIMDVRVSVGKGKIQSVAINMVPTFVYETDQKIDVKGFGKISIDLVCAGGFFAMVDAEKIGIEPVKGNRKTLTDLGMKIIEAANEQVCVSHPERAEVKTVDVAEFYDSRYEKGKYSGKGVIIYGEAHADRSPCGTGTAAKLTLLNHYKKIQVEQAYKNHSPLGTFFDAKILRKEKIGNFDGCIVQIKGMAYLTGIHHFIVEGRDPFQKGFIM